MAGVSRIGLPHLVISVAVELEMLDSVVSIENTEPRILIMRVRGRVQVKLGSIAQGNGHVEFDAVTLSPRTPISTVVFARVDPERDRCCFRPRRVNPDPPTCLLGLGMRR